MFLNRFNASGKSYTKKTVSETTFSETTFRIYNIFTLLILLKFTRVIQF